MEEWAQRPAVLARLRNLQDSYRNSKFGANVTGDLRPEFVLIHTFAHLIINQLSFECGYGSSSIRERIYCEKAENEYGMYGVLIYTASGDSEGSLGGLVRQGAKDHIEDTIRDAVRNAAWCSSDPVCIQSYGQGPESCNLAACHNCALLPETCCECGNRLLDRGTVVGTLDNKSIALKNPCLEEQWRKRYTQVLAAAPSSKRTKPPARALARPPFSTLAKPAGESYYQFCNVQFKEDGATYAYLTGGISLKAGDFVVVPIGDHQAEKLARVTEVFVCSTQNAPYPPEKAKFVLRKSERTAFPERTKPQHPAPKQAAAPAPTELKRAVPPVQSAPTANPQKSAPTVQSAITPPIVSQTPTEPEITEKKSTLSKKPFPFGKLIAAVLAVTVIAGISISISNRNKQRTAAYDAALQELSNGNYTSAEQDFSELSGYRDAASLSVYCKYAGMYKDRTDYAGGQDELANITLQYDTGWQQDVDALETRVKGYKAEKDAAEEAERQRIAAENAAKREQSLKDQYSGKLPVDGMPVSCLKYTSLGSPTKTEKCQFYDSMDVHRRYKILHWYNSEGQTVAYCHSHQPKGEYTEVIYAFTYYETPIGRPNSAPAWTPPSTSGGNNSGSVRDDYDNPEDLWEDNPDWYEDEDEAWDEWENG